MKPNIIIGTRGSKLALWQAEHIAGLLRQMNPGMAVTLKHIVTTGDKILDVPLAQIGGKGLFTKELEVAMLAGEIDLAVHSLKDMPTELPAGLTLAALDTLRERYRKAGKHLRVLHLSERSKKLLKRARVHHE